MANTTKLPTITEFLTTQLARFDYGLPALGRALSATGTTLRLNAAAKKADGTVITGGVLLGVETETDYVEHIWCPLASSTDGITFTGVVRGVRVDGIDYTTGVTANAIAHKSGARVFCVVSAVIENLIRKTLGGEIATGGANFVIGTDADGTVTIKRCTAVAGTYQGFIRWNTSTDKVEYSNDGSTWNSLDAVVASTLSTISSGDSTPAHLESKVVDDNDTIVITKLNAGGNEQLRIATGYSATKAEIDQALDGISANVTAENLSTLNGGAGSNADALHTHLNLGNYSFTAYENIAQYDAVALLGVEVEYYSQLTDANLALGDSNARRKYAVKIIPTVTSSSLTTMQFRAAEAVSGATALGNLTISIQSDSAGAPSGTAITNGTANAISQATQRTWTNTMGTRTATWASSPTLTAGTAYWIVWECSATDATNYLNLSVNSFHDEDYLTFTRLTYNLDTTTWGSSTTNATPFFWFNSQVKLLGMAVVPTDANWGGRTWSFIGFAQTAITAQSSGVISTDYATLTGLTPNSPYYLSTTAGQITTTPPAGVYVSGTQPTSFTYKIGQALYSTTILKIQRGTKRIMISEDGLSATTTRQYITWFPVEFLRVSGTGTGSNDSAVSQGYVLADGTDGCVNMNYVNATAGTAVYDGSNSLYTRGDNTDKFTGAAANFTNAGFQYTYTRGGTGVVYATIEVIG